MDKLKYEKTRAMLSPCHLRITYTSLHQHLEDLIMVMNHFQLLDQTNMKEHILVSNPEHSRSLIKDNYIFLPLEEEKFAGD